MTDSITEADLANADEENDPIVIVDSDDDPYRGLRAKPEDRIQITRGIRIEDFFGICAEEFDDESMEAMRALRGKRSSERYS
jgi:hypothetical protein